ncbi:MAG: hypothetical protein MZV64_02625 [Ignavibacteriales bacterium]|nr:hypothetical protein [Ignavibacteriales bacterium]
MTLALTYAEIPYADASGTRRCWRGKLAEVRLAPPAPRGFHWAVRKILQELPERRMVCETEKPVRIHGAAAGLSEGLEAEARRRADDPRVRDRTAGFFRHVFWRRIRSTSRWPRRKPTSAKRSSTETPLAGDWPASAATTGNACAFEKFTGDDGSRRSYEYSDIDTTPQDPILAQVESDSYFTLFDFSAKYDPVPSHADPESHGRHTRIHGADDRIPEKPGEAGGDGARREAGIGRGHTPARGRRAAAPGHFWAATTRRTTTIHRVGTGPTDLSFHRNSPGYRLILNNILFPAARKKERKT